MPLSDYPIADALATANSVVAPTSGAAFCTLAAPPAGIYEIEAAWELTATAETLINNVRLKINGANFISGLMSHSGAGRMVKKLGRITLDGVNTVQLTAGAAATAGAAYNGDISAIRIG